MKKAPAAMPGLSFQLLNERIQSGEFDVGLLYELLLGQAASHAEHCFEFSHIAWPCIRILDQLLPSVARHLVGRLAPLSRELGRIRCSEVGDILPPFSEWRDVDCYPVEPIEQIEPKALVRNRFDEVLVRRYDDARRRTMLLFAADSEEDSFLEYLQQLVLKGERYLPDLVEEECPSSRAFEASSMCRDGACEGALFVSEELRYRAELSTLGDRLMVGQRPLKPLIGVRIPVSQPTRDRLSVAKKFASMDFFSRLLHSLAPDVNGIWRQKARLSVEISGWPKNISWERKGDNLFEGKIKDVANFDLEQYSQILEAALVGITEGEDGSAGSSTLYRFSIGNGQEWKEYRFHSKSRTIAALCVLYDKEAHSRNHLEINIPRNLGPQIVWPFDLDNEELQRTYGDPSKTADELRNEGWSRFGDATAMKVYRERVGGQIQQMYQLLKTDQTTSSQMMRTNIPKKWKDGLYESQDFTCQICLTKYDASNLEPDHRIPVIFEADGLTEENYKQKLMTLCRFCNQQKRETTKRLPADYDWSTSPWAFPEKFDLQTAKKRIELYAKRTSKTYKQALKELGNE
jgi:5-methylcytosine-specific restriction endonuclease McrA